MVAGGDLVMDGAYPDLFAGYIAYKRAAGYAMARNWQYPARGLSRFLASKPPAPEVLTSDYVNEFCERRGDEAASTQNHRMSTCRQFALYLQTLGYDSYVRPDQLTLRGTAFIPRIITEEEMARVIAAADAMPAQPNAPTAHKVFPVLVRILWSCGLRLGEALSLTAGDVDLANGVLTIRNAKGGKSRIVPISSSLRGCLERYWLEMGLCAAAPGAGVFPSRRRDRYWRSYAAYRIKGFMAEAGVLAQGGRTPRVHDIRHSFAVAALAKMDADGVDLYCALPLLTAYMGHSDIKSTEYYLRFTESAMEAVLSKMEGPYSDLFPEVEDA